MQEDYKVYNALKNNIVTGRFTLKSSKSYYGIRVRYVCTFSYEKND